MDMQVQIKYDINGDPEKVQVHFANSKGETNFSGTILDFTSSEYSVEVITIRLPGLAKVTPYDDTSHS